MRNTGNLVFKADLGIVPFHLGCNALVIHPNCGICRPSLYLAGKVEN